MVIIENNSPMIEITCFVAILWVLSFIGTFAHKVAQTLLFLHDTWHTKIFGLNYFVEVVRIVNHSHILNITS